MAICYEQIFEQRKKEAETETQPKTPEKTTNLRADATNSMLLQTAQVLICHPAGEKKVIRARVVFDSGSQQSYILAGRKQQLNLPTVAKENVVVNVFGNSHGTSQTLSSVSMIVKNPWGDSNSEVEIDAWAVPHICAPVQGQEIDLTQRSFAHLKDLKLADLSSDEGIGNPIADRREPHVELFYWREYYFWMGVIGPRSKDVKI